MVDLLADSSKWPTVIEIQWKCQRFISFISNERFLSLPCWICLMHLNAGCNSCPKRNRLSGQVMPSDAKWTNPTAICRYGLSWFWRWLLRSLVTILAAHHVSSCFIYIYIISFSSTPVQSGLYLSHKQTWSHGLFPKSRQPLQAFHSGPFALGSSGFSALACEVCFGWQGHFSPGSATIPSTLMDTSWTWWHRHSWSFMKSHDTSKAW